MDVSNKIKNQTVKKRILVVDDDEVYLYTTKRILENEHIEVFTHLNWLGVTNIMRKILPDLVLLDINMPALAGDKLADLLRRNTDLLHIPIVFHSSNDEESLRTSVEAHGVNGYICKGDVGILQKNVNHYLGISALESVTANRQYCSIRIEHQPISGMGDTDLMAEAFATRKKKIMVVDDDEIHLEIAKELIEDEEYEVITHHDGFGAFDRVKVLQPDLVLIDINMSGLSGERLAVILRDNKDTRHVPIVFYSSNDENSLRESVLACDVQGYIYKGDLVNLRKRVSHYLSGPSRGSVTEKG